MIVLDTNLLVYAHRKAVPEHKSAQRAIESACSQGRGVGIALASLAEFFSVVTHPKATGRPSTAQEASEFIELLAETGGVRVCLPRFGFHQRLFLLAQDLGVVGARIFDLQIALTGLDHGATQLWTRDRHFVAVPGLELVNPI